MRCKDCKNWEVECFPDDYPDWADPDEPEKCPEYIEKQVLVKEKEDE